MKKIESSKYIFRTNYYADESGHIWSEYKKDFLTEYDDKNGYKKVVLMTTDKPAGKGHRFSVHRLILSTFCPNKNSHLLTIDHLDGDITNNKLENLRWATMKENLENPNTLPNRRCYDQDGLSNSSSKFTKESLENLILDINSGNFKRKEILEKYGICDETLRNVILKKTYKIELENVEITPNFLSDYGRDTKGVRNGRAKLKEDDIREIVSLIIKKEKTLKAIASQFGVSVSTINRIKSKTSWTELTKDVIFD